MRRALAFSAFVSFSLGATSAFAAGRTLEAIPFAGAKIRIDGDLREWPGKMTELGQTLSGSAGGDHAAAQIGYDDSNLYVAFRIADKKLVRTSSYGTGEDYCSLFIAFPSGKGGFSSHEIRLFQGDPGKVAGAVRDTSGAISGAQLVEAPAKNGYAFEAKIPWSAFPEAAKTRVGLRGAFRFNDVDGPGATHAVFATSAATSGGSLPPLQLEAEQGLEANLIHGKNLPTSPARVAYGDLNGDKFVERIAVYGGFLTIVGPKYKGGTQFYFGELGVSDANQITRLDLRDFDGDGSDEILIGKKIGSSDKYREIIEILKIGSDEAPWSAFNHEVSIVTKDGKVQNDVSITRKGKLPAIVVSQGKSEGFEPDSYAEPVSDDMPAALLPWQNIKSQTYQWDGKSFSKVDEQTGPGAPVAKGKGKKKKKAVSAGPPQPPVPRAPTADEMLDRLYALYRKERRVGTRAPRFDFVTDVAGNSDTERVLVHDKDIVVFGKGYRGGTTYSFITIGVADPKDVVDVTARDLTGDGKAEIVVRGVLHAKASKELGGDTVDRYAFFVYQVQDTGIRRVFAAETGRALKDNQIIGSIAFLPDKAGTRIELRPGHAVGWTEKSYPFPPDTTAAGGLEPLILPWASSGARKYKFDGGLYALQ